MTRTVPALAALLAVAPGGVRAEAPGPEARQWRLAAYVDAYLLPGEDGYLVPTVFADHEPVHLEARYNYEDFDTASLWVGWTFAFEGEGKYLKLTPMLGGVVGNTDGMAPGLEVEARWGRVAYWLEAEYLFDFADSSASYLYTWSELNLYALPWLWFGGSLQRMKPVETATEVDLAPMVGVGRQEGSPGWSLSFYVYGLAKSEQQYLLTAAVTF